MARREPDNLEKLVIFGKVEGKRSRGRSPSRWVDQVKQLVGAPVTDALRKAESRDKWRTLTSNVLAKLCGHDLQQ
ncbi:hypothetical protein NE865_16193 [Phthorimaea operculella]|nr:hypothetical protein NE865_16193 [Phthorimaea operculella]